MSLDWTRGRFTSNGDKIDMRLSVIMPSYNTPPKILERSVSSVVRATSADDEIIVIDDCSNKYLQAFDAIKQICPDIIVVHLEQNRGQAHARNVGLSLAKGGYIAFIDSDDEVLEQAYEKSINALIDAENDIAVYGVKTKWDDLNLSKIDSLDDRNYGVLDVNGFSEIWRKCLFTYPWNKVYRKEFIDQHSLRFKEQCIPREDEVFNFECIINKAKWVGLNYIGHIYYHQSNSSLGRYRPYNHESNISVENARRECLRFLGCEDCSVLGIREMSENDLLLSDWQNLWRNGSPYSHIERYRWLRQSLPNVSFFGRVKLYVKTLVCAVIRKYFYFRLFRRIHIKRLHKNIVSE